MRTSWFLLATLCGCEALPPHEAPPLASAPEPIPSTEAVPLPEPPSGVPDAVPDPAPATRPDSDEVPAPPPSPAGPLPCSALAGTYRATEERECGRGAQCLWSLTFEGDRYGWAYSDIHESGRFLCKGGTLRATTGGTTRTGTLTGTGLLWEGDAYVAFDPVAPSPPPKPAPMPPHQPQTAFGTAVPPLAKSAQQARGCQTNSDCRVSTLRDGDCCRAGCGPSQAYNTAFLAELSPYLAELCTGRSRACPAMACRYDDYFAICKDGLCTAQDSPF